MLGLIGKTLGPYHLLDQVGQGGMSSVFRAADLRDGRQVAVKILSPYLAHEAQFHARFEREVKLLRRLQHPNIIQILDHGETEGLAYIVMPFLGTGTLQDRLRQGPLGPMEGGKIIGQLASALTCAHENGVIHRDIKPSNVLLDDIGNAILTDFSFAHPQDASQNLTGSALIGTPAYMSPEQCRGEPITTQSDQYSFAIMLYQITTGQLPFEGDTPMAVAIQHVNVPLPRPRQVNPNLPEDVELVLIKALAKDPALRFSSVGELNRAFQAALGAALDPKHHPSGIPTLSVKDSQAIYRRYQNVKPPARKGWLDRSAVAVALLALLACTVSAAAMTVAFPGVFGAAPAVAKLGDGDIQATVDVLLTANAPAPGTIVAPGAMETAVYAAVMQTLQAVPIGSLTATETPPTVIQATATAGASHALVLAAATSSPTRTATRRPTATRTRTPSGVPTGGPTSTVSGGGGASSTPTASLPAPTDTFTAVPPTATSPPPTSTTAPTSTSAPPSATSAPPSATSAPPSHTPPPPTSTSPSLICQWDTGGEQTHGDTVTVRIHNTGGLTLHITQVTITWSGNENLRRIRLNGTIWSGFDDGPTVSVGTNKTISAGSSRTAEFEFWGSHFSGSADVHIDGDC